MNKKQATLFQSWGNRACSSEQKSIQPAAQASTSSVNDDVIDLCGSFEDDDDDLLCEAEESVSNVSGHTGAVTFANNSREHNDQDQHVGDVSVGADGFMPTQAQTQNSNLTGFDKSAGKLWIYPTNYPVRDYQFDIVKQALFKNTMVTLPTGLGKTFIAAVVMYNFYRWYPQGKVIFMAPTKPLVAQQIEACYNIMGIPQDHTAEMTGSMGPSKRERAWHDKRVFFLTPQVLTNDLSRGSCPAHYVKCLVIDEAHKALGNHAYCQVVRELVKYTENFRVLSLSATPGSDIKAVQQVLNNLLISQIEIRTEESNDIKKYSHERKVDKVVVPLGDELTKVKTKYIQIMDVVVNKLKRYGVLYNRDTTSLSKFLILKAREAFRQNPPEKLQRNQYGIVEGDFALAMSLYHGFELLQLHGSRSLYNFLEGILTGDKGYGRTRTELTRNADFNELIGLLSGKYTAPESETASQARAKPFVIGHPKMEKLQKIVLDHFNTHSDAGTRVMIFSQYRDSVQEITDMLHVHQPIIKVMSFIGQATAGKSTKGFTQKEQLKVMKQFREGGYNTLVSTCVGEEGLDIGDVDLIICFDAHKSPIRLVQRMGRTGRKREGRIVMLVTQGKEEQIYNQSQYSKKSIHKAILNGAKSLHFYQHSPRMLPENSVPTCHKMHITVKENFKPTRKISTDKEANQSKITTMMTDAASKKDQSEEIITLEEYRELEPWLIPDEEIPKLPTSSITCLEQEDTNEEQQEHGRFLSLSEWTPWQNTLQDTKLVDHSLGSKHLVQIMEFIQLQQSLDPSDDPYGLEMAAYLNEEDILKPGETEVPALLTFLAPKQNKTNGDKGKIGKKSDEKPKSRRSENLPKFDFLDDRMEISSDESLPEFKFSRVTKETGDIENSELGITRKPDTVQKKLTVTRKVLNDENIPAPDIHEVNDIDKKFEDCTNKTTDVVKDVQMSSLKSKKSGFVSKAKSLEKRMTIGNARRRKKYRQNSGHTSIIEFIADDDLADFDCSRVVSDMLSKKQCVENEDAAGSRPLIEENCQILSDDSDSELCKISSFKDMSTEIFRIRTPPSVEEVAKVCEAFGTGSKFGDVDFIDAIDEWHRENKQGKYIVYPESMLNDSITDFCRNRKSDKKKMSISVVDIKLKEPFSNEKLVPDKRTQIERMDNKRDKTVLKTAIDNPNSNALTDMNTFCAIDNPNSNAFTDMNTSCALDNPNSNAFTDMNTSADLENGLKLKNRKKLFKSPLNDKQVDKECLKGNERKIRHSVHVDDEMEVDVAHDILLKSPTFVASDGKHHLKENEIKFTHLDRSDQDDTDLNEKDDIACTGNFMLNADDMFTASDDWMAEDLVEMKDKSNEASSVLLQLSESKKLAEKGMYDNRILDNDLEITHVSDNNTSAKLQKSSNCTSSLGKNKRISGADYSFVTENIGKKRNYNNESSSNQKVNMSFSNLDKPKYDSFLSDDKDDDLFMVITTPSTTKVHETSTQITFTQALDFVHSGIGASGSSEACIKSHGNENGHGFENKINASKNRIIENPSPKFNLKKTLLGFNSTDESISDEDERQIKDCSKVINYNMSIVDEDVSEDGRDLSEKKVSRKESSSSESVIDMPEFDLGFEFDDDVIPPSPKATQVSQKSSSNRLSQAFTFTNCLSQSRCDASGETFYDDKYGSKLEKIKIGERNNFGANNVKVLKSKKSLDLNDTHIEDVEKSIKNNEEESQSLFNDIVNVPLRPLSKKTKFSLDAIQENSEDDFFENTEKDVVNSKTHSDNETKTSGKIENGITEPFATKSDLNTEQEIEGNCTGAFETSFALLGEDLEDWIDSGAEFQVQNDPKQKNDDLTNFDNEKSCDSFLASQKSLENFRQKVNTPVAAVSPITFSQEKNDKHSVRDKQAKELPLRLNKNVRKSVFRLDDLSSDSFDDSFNFTSDMVLDKGTSRTSTGMMPVLHNTSTPLIHQSKKVQSVTPFRMSENNNPDRANDFTPVKASNTLPDLNTHSESPFREMSRIPEGTPIQKADESGRYLSRLDSSEEKDDDSFIVRRKKKVKILDSPLTQKENIVKNCMTKDQSHEKDNQEKTKKGTAFMISSDDDDFDDSFMLIKNNYTTKKSIPQLEQSSDEDFEESFAESNIQVPWKNASKDITINNKRKQHEKVKLKSKQKRTSNPFIDEEAELSEEGDSNASSDEHEGSDLDRYEGSFISDSQNTQSQALNDTDVHALYLKSVKSPVGHRGGFKLQFNHRTDVDVFSQKQPPEDSHYMEDSFCVGSADEEEEDDWLLGEGGDESEEELREVTLIQNSVMHTGRKRRRGLQAFQTSRQRAIQMGRMKALSEIRTKLAGKMKRPAKKQKLSSSEDENGKVDAPKTKRSRIQLNNDTSSDEENALVLNRSDLMSPKVQPMPKSKKRSRLLLSSDNSESEDEFYESRSMCRSNKSVKLVNRQVNDRNGNLNEKSVNKISAVNGHQTADELRQERLRKQKEKQAEYRRQMAERKVGDSKGLDSIVENSSTNALTKLKEKSVTNNEAHNDDFDFVRPINEDKFDDTDLLINSTVRNSKFDGKLVILVDSKEISGSQDIISDLRFKHDINVSAAQLHGCDYIVSNRMAVERKQWSEFSNGSNRAKLIERMQYLGELYDRPCLIVEKDRIKPGEEKSVRQVHWTKYVDRTIALLQRSDIKILFTDNFTETAVLLADLCRLEHRKNMAIQVPIELNDEQSHRVKFFVSLPKLSYVHALNLCDGFKSVSDFLKSSAVLIECRGKMSKNRAVEVYNYIRRMFDQNLLPTNYK